MDMELQTVTMDQFTIVVVLVHEAISSLRQRMDERQVR